MIRLFLRALAHTQLQPTPECRRTAPLSKQNAPEGDF
jgi:hypothetical protein